MCVTTGFGLFSFVRCNDNDMIIDELNPLCCLFFTSLRKSEVNCLLPAKSTACGETLSDSTLTRGLGQGKLISQGYEKHWLCRKRPR